MSLSPEATSKTGFLILGFERFQEDFSLRGILQRFPHLARSKNCRETLDFKDSLYLTRRGNV